MTPEPKTEVLPEGNTGAENQAPRALDEADVLVTPSGEVIDLSLMGNLKIQFESHSPIKNGNRFKSMKYGLAGLIYLVAREQSIKAASIFSVLIVGVGLWLHLSAVAWALLALAIGQVWVTECLNTGIESAINLGTDAPHPIAKIGKDVASAAALVSAFVLLAVVAALFTPRLLARLHGVG